MKSLLHLFALVSLLSLTACWDFPDQAVRSFAELEVEAEQTGKTIICTYTATAYEEKLDSAFVQVGNFPLFWIKNYDSYTRPELVEVKYKGKRYPSSEDLKPLVKPFKPRAQVVSLHNIRRKPYSCKIFAPDDPQSKSSPH